jgi:hypothetical protein
VHAMDAKKLIKFAKVTNFGLHSWHGCIDMPVCRCELRVWSPCVPRASTTLMSVTLCTSTCNTERSFSKFLPVSVTVTSQVWRDLCLMFVLSKTFQLEKQKHLPL